ncbi:hypothetical protein GCM10027418_28330 [Mariniluteicoccus endophyticus]
MSWPTQPGPPDDRGLTSGHGPQDPRPGDVAPTGPPPAYPSPTRPPAQPFTPVPYGQGATPAPKEVDRSFPIRMWTATGVIVVLLGMFGHRATSRWGEFGLFVGGFVPLVWGVVALFRRRPGAGAVAIAAGLAMIAYGFVSVPG